MTILLVEQNVRKAFEVADYIYVINRGSILSHGEKDAVERDTHITRGPIWERVMSLLNVKASRRFLMIFFDARRSY